MKERRKKKRRGKKTSEPSVFPQRICHTPFSRLVERSWRSHALDHPPFLSRIYVRDVSTCVCNVSQRVEVLDIYIYTWTWNERGGHRMEEQPAWYTDDSATNKPNKNNALSCICKWTLSFYFDGNESRGPSALGLPTPPPAVDNNYGYWEWLSLTPRVLMPWNRLPINKFAVSTTATGRLTFSFFSFFFFFSRGQARSPPIKVQEKGWKLNHES